jgi:hypothetical protein
MCQIELGKWVAEAAQAAGKTPPEGWPPLTIPDARSLVDTYLSTMSPLQYDQAAVALDSTLTVDDILRANLLNARISGNDVVALLDANWGWANVNEAIASALANVPTDLGLTTDISEEQWSSLQALFAAVLRPGIRAAKTTKILHKKRPCLIPIADRLIVDFTGTKFGYGWRAKPGEPDGLVEVVKRIRRDILANLEVLNALSVDVPGLSGLTIVRVFDIIVWQAAQDGLLGPTQSGGSGPADPTDPSGQDQGLVFNIDDFEIFS